MWCPLTWHRAFQNHSLAGLESFPFTIFVSMIKTNSIGAVIATPLGSKNNFHLWYEASSFTPQGSAAFYNLRALDTEWCPFANRPLSANFLSA